MTPVRRGPSVAAKVSSEATPETAAIPVTDASAAESAPRNSLAARLPQLLLLLFTGTLSTIIAQHVLDKDIADTSVQHLAFTKYAAILAVPLLASLWRILSRIAGRRSTVAKQEGGNMDMSKFETVTVSPPRSRRATGILVTLAMLDVVSYFIHCLGFALCGSALATVVFAASAQLLTAAMTRCVLKRRLLRGQQMAVLLVCVGIALRGAAYSFRPNSSSGNGAGGGQWWGVAAMLGSALGYSTLGVLYDLLIRTEQPPPSHAEIMRYTSRIGLAASVAYQMLYTLPRWQSLVGAHLESGKTSALHAFALLALFGVAYNIHSYAQGRVQRMEGALGVGLVTAVRSATVSLASGALFCSPVAPSQCLTPLSATSALVVTAAGVVWVTAAAPQKLKLKEG